MEKDLHQLHEKLTGHETQKTNEHTDMPVKTTATDTIKNTAEGETLNQAGTTNNDLEPGTTLPGDE